MDHEPMLQILLGTKNGIDVPAAQIRGGMTALLAAARVQKIQRVARLSRRRVARRA